MRGNAQIVERDGVRQLQITSPTTFRVKLPEILPVGAGESQPVADSDTESGRRQNRRVVVGNTSGM